MDDLVVKNITIEVDKIQYVNVNELHDELLKITADKYLQLFNLMQKKMNDSYNVEKILIKFPEEDVTYE